MNSANPRALVVGVALIATGGLVSICGLAISGTAMLSSIRHWVQEQQEPPSAVMKRKISQAKAATTAGASAWQNEGGTAARTR
jgi:hypothetical protein